MTFGRLFTIMNPNVRVRKNGTCIWLYLDDVNYYTIRAEWWDKEIPDNAITVLKEHEEGEAGMADPEKVIKALSICSKTGWCENNTDCPYFDSDKESHFEDCKRMLKDALELLKEQELIKSKTGKWISRIRAVKRWKEVKWDE